MDKSIDDMIDVTIWTSDTDRLYLKCFRHGDCTLPAENHMSVTWTTGSDRYGGDLVTEFKTKNLFDYQIQVLQDLMDRFFYNIIGKMREDFCFSSLYGTQTIKVSYSYHIASNVSILKMGTGTGKTLVSCAFMENLFLLDKNLKFTIVCPRKIISQWREEITETSIPLENISLIGHTTDTNIDSDIVIIDEFTDKKILVLGKIKYKYCRFDCFVDCLI